MRARSPVHSEPFASMGPARELLNAGSTMEQTLQEWRRNSVTTLTDTQFIPHRSDCRDIGNWNVWPIYGNLRRCSPLAKSRDALGSLLEAPRAATDAEWQLADGRARPPNLKILCVSMSNVQ